MAGKIQLLSDEVIGKIAAGEVVERPSAAIKEMVENSLDAGATAVTVEIRDGGISYFRVTDNGSGIEQSEIRMAFERHATSKITRSQDLNAIRTLGFRGEALASIAAVARVSCTTRTKKDASGIRVTNVGGRIEKIEEAACPEGTSFVVKDLFFNTPVRLKFLKKPATEAGYVSDLMMRLILSRPDVSFRYISQGKTLYHSAGDGRMQSAVFSIYGKELLRSMREVDGHQSGVMVKGFVGVGDSARGSRGHQSFFINGRYMRSGLLSSAVESACRERIPAGKYPVCVLHLTMPFDMVDVNVHPNKLECRFQNDQAMAEAIEAIVSEALKEKSVLDKPETLSLTPAAPETERVAPASVKKAEAVPAVVKPATTVPTPIPAPIRPAATVPAAVKPAVDAKPAQPAVVPAAAANSATPPVLPVTKPFVANQPQPQQKASDQSAVKPLQPLNPQSGMKPLQPIRPMLRQTESITSRYLDVPVPPMSVHQPAAAAPQQPKQVESFLPDAPKPLKLMGTAFNAYIVAEYGDSLLLIDQRGVHERLLFDRMMKAYDQKVCGQELLLPIIVPVTRREQQLLEEHRELLEGLGLAVEPFGETEASIRSIPMILGQPQAGELVREILDQLEGERGVISLEKRRSAIMALACKKAVKSGERLNEGDVRALVSRMVDENITPTSPRGTPLIIALPHADLERRFRRMQ